MLINNWFFYANRFTGCIGLYAYKQNIHERLRDILDTSRLLGLELGITNMH